MIGLMYNSHTLQTFDEWLPKTLKLDNVVEKTVVFDDNQWCWRLAVTIIGQLRILLD